MLSGRLFGDVELPPRDPSEWQHNTNCVYGCCLCYQLKHGPTKLYYASDAQELIPVNFPYSIQDEHGHTLNLEQLPDNVSVCMSVGHVYARSLYGVIDSREYQPLSDDVKVITILNLDLPYGALVKVKGKLYNRGATIVEAPSTIALVGLSTMNYRLSKALGDFKYYQLERERFIHDLDEFLTEPWITSDTEVGLQASRVIVENSTLFNTCLPLYKMMESGYYGVMFQSRINSQKLVFKYMNTETNWQVAENEVSMVQLINENLERRPDLPYPYTFTWQWCARFDIHSQAVPVCPPATTKSNIIALVQEYIDNVGTLHIAIERFDSSLAVLMVIESIATLAEAHQGDTVQNHFMHMDSHTGNFLVSRCTDRTCNLNNTRLTNLGGYHYLFGRYGFKVYLIDFGFSYLIGSLPKKSLNSDIHWEIDGLMPAIDLITLLRSAVPQLTLKVMNEYSASTQRGTVSPELVKAWDQCKKLLKLTAVMVVEHVVNLTWKTRTQYGMPTEQPIPEGDEYLHPVFVAQYLSSLREVETAQHVVLTVLDGLISKFEKDYTLHLTDVEMYKKNFNLLSGIYYFDYDSGETLARFINQKTIDPLPERVKHRLGIKHEEPAGLQGIARFLWYLSSMGAIP